MIDREMTVKGLREISAYFSDIYRNDTDSYKCKKAKECSDVVINAIVLLERQEINLKFYAEKCDEFYAAAKSRVKVIRCKDCKYGDQLCDDYISCEISEENESGCHLSHKSDWFCADGVAKDINVPDKER